MKVTPKNNLLVVKKHVKTALKADITLHENEEDKKLITGEVTVGFGEYENGTTVIFGKYALLKLTINGEDFYFLDADDVVGICDYKE